MAETRRTQRRGGNGAANRANGAHASDKAPNTVDDVLQRCSFEIAKEGLSDELGASNAVLRGAVALREMQIDAARRTQATHSRAAEQMQSAHSVAELSSVGLLLAQADAEGAVRYWSDWAGIVARTGIDTWNEAFGACLRAQGLAQQVGRQWSEVAATATPETLEAQAEHATTPVTSSPFVWPTQEAIREAMTLSARGWSEWLGRAGAGGQRNG